MQSPCLTMIGLILRTCNVFLFLSTFLTTIIVIALFKKLIPGFASSVACKIELRDGGNFVEWALGTAEQEIAPVSRSISSRTNSTSGPGYLVSSSSLPPYECRERDAKESPTKKLRAFQDLRKYIKADCDALLKSFDRIDQTAD